MFYGKTIIDGLTAHFKIEIVEDDDLFIPFMSFEIEGMGGEGEEFGECAETREDAVEAAREWAEDLESDFEYYETRVAEEQAWTAARFNR